MAGEAPDFSVVEGKVVEAMQRLQVPGVAIGILANGQEYAAGFGVTNIENPLPVDTNTLFQIGSNTKTMTATVAMRLAEMDKLDLNAPVRQYLPDFKMQDESVAANITVRELFTHRAGWLGDFFEDTGDGDDALAKYVAKMADLPQWTPRGTVWSYNNASFSLAGRVIEAVTGKTFEAAFKELLLDPLGLKQSFFFAGEVMTMRVAAGHTADEKGAPVIARNWPLPRSANAAGGISASVKDMLRYARFHMGDGTAEDGTRLLTKESLNYMQTPMDKAANMADNMGLSWMIRDIPGAHIIQHGGGTNGHISAFMLAPQQNFAIVILTNAMRGGELNSEISKWAFQHFLGAEEPELAPIEIAQTALLPYVGKYQIHYAEIEIALREGGLAMQMRQTKGLLADKDRVMPPPGPFVKLTVYDIDKVVVAEGATKGTRMDFLRDEEGAIKWFRAGSRIFSRVNPPEDHSAKFSELSKQAKAWLSEYQVPGAVIGVQYKGKEYTAAFGVTNVENPLPVTLDTYFQIGSTTKTMTATLAMRLVEMGKLDLDAPVRQYLPDLKLADENVAANVKVRHLFNHTAGWLGDVFDDTGNGDDYLAEYVKKLEKTPQLTPLGEVWSYNNAAFNLAGRVIEVVTGKTYEAALKELVLDPMGLNQSLIFTRDIITRRYVSGHIVMPDGSYKLAIPWAIPRSANPAGGVSATVKDQLRYARFHLGDGKSEDGTRLLSKASMEFMQTPQVSIGDLADDMGFGWMIRNVGGVKIVQHGGTTNGQQSAFEFAPAENFAVTVMTNSTRGGEYHHAVTRLAEKLFLGVSEEEATPLKLSDEELAPYAGVYKGAYSDNQLTPSDGGFTFTMTPTKGALNDEIPPAPPPMKVALIAENKVMAIDGPYKGLKGVFLRDTNNKVVWLRFGGRVAAKQN